MFRKSLALIQWLYRICFVSTALFSMSSCSVFIEANRPGYVDTSVVQSGVPRSTIVSELGDPVYSYNHDGTTADVYLLDNNGRHAATKIGLTTFNLAADVLTAGMWEAVASPLEDWTQHRLTTYLITYGPNDEVASVETPKPPDGPVMAVTAESEVQVGNVDAVYLSVINLSPDELKLENAEAIAGSGESAQELSIDAAIKEAGGADQLAAALDRLPSALTAASQGLAAFVPGTQANSDSGAGLLGPLLVIDYTDAFVAIMAPPVVTAISPGSTKIRSGALSGEKLRVRHSLQGYVCFPRGNYSAVRIDGRTGATGDSPGYDKGISCQLPSR